MKLIFAFTISEVLISLVVLGIIAAITIPLIYENYQKNSTKSALTKNYSILQQALQRYYVDNGEKLTSTNLESSLHVSLAPYFISLKKTSGSYSNFMSVNYHTYNNKAKVISWYFDDGSFHLNDGSIIYIEDPKGSTTRYFSVDINGMKKPNRLGRDLFMFQLMQDGKLLPMGAEGTDFPVKDFCSTNGSFSHYNTNGAGCSSKFLIAES